jgi:hypothetical protein
MSSYPPGWKVVDEGNCPKGAQSALGCMFCSEGHMTECHQGKSCYEAQCDHLLQS